MENGFPFYLVLLKKEPNEYFFDNLFGKKSKTKGEVEIVTSSENKDIDTQSGKAENGQLHTLRTLLVLL